MTEYIIVGDTAQYKDCLVYTCGTDKSWADKVLERMLTNPTEQDKRELKKHSNLRVEPVSEKEQWWNDPFLAN